MGPRRSRSLVPPLDARHQDIRELASLASPVGGDPIAGKDGLGKTANDPGRTLADTATSGDRFGSSLPIAPNLTRIGFGL
jgi:hypothetical protein